LILRINPFNLAELATSTGKHIALGQRLPLEEFNGHDLTVRLMDEWFLLIQIRFDKKIIQQGFVQSLSATAGRLSCGGPIIQEYAIEINPDVPIFPISELVSSLIDIGVKSHKISPMFDDRLDDHATSSRTLQMWSDGEIRTCHYTYEDRSESIPPPRTEFIVRNATWAVRRSGGETGPSIHIYLWMSAADKAEEVLRAVQLLMKGEGVSGAVCAR